ncbi:MAG: hypothetical protein HOQ01_13265 [Lysobacter sp.]|nr:hypothetical protein [Lysobacter sp.]
MNAEKLGSDPNAFGEPKSLADLIALAQEIRVEFSRIRGRMSRILANKDALEAA